MNKRLEQETVRKEGLLQSEIIEKITYLLHKINDTQLLERIYRFVQYIYIHKT